MSAKLQLALWISRTWTTQWSQANAKGQIMLQRDAAHHWRSWFALWRIKWTTSRATAPTSFSVTWISTASTLRASLPPSARRAIRASTVETSPFPVTPKVGLPHLHLPSPIYSCPFHCCFSSFDWGMWFLVAHHLQGINKCIDLMLFTFFMCNTNTLFNLSIYIYDICVCVYGWIIFKMVPLCLELWLMHSWCLFLFFVEYAS